MACPNINSSQWKNLVSKIGTFEAFKEFIKNGEEIPDANNYQETFKGTNATLKITQALVNPKIEGFFKNQYLKGNRDKFFNEVAAIAGKQQTNLLREHLNNNTYTSVPEMIAGLLAEMNYTVQINTAKGGNKDLTIQQTEFKGEKRWSIVDSYTTMPLKSFKTEQEANNYLISELQKPTSHYSTLTVPGGTNYTENEIATPAITPSIKGHAQFATDNGIGWFRSDDKIADKLQISLGKELDYNDPYIPTSSKNRFKQYEVLDESKNNIGTVIIEYRGKNSVILHPKLNVINKGYGKRLYKLISDKFNVEIREWNEGPISNSSSAKKMWDSLEKEGVAKRIIDEESGDNFRVLNYNIDTAKTRRILEVQSDLFQKGRDREDLESSPNFQERLDSGEKWDDVADELNKRKGNQFLQLLNKDNNWVTFFVKSIIQDNAKKGYEKVLFPTGNTASKVEGHTTLEEFKKQKEDRIKELESKKTTLPELIKDLKEKDKNDYEGIYNYNIEISRFEKEFNNIDNEINQLKQELERVETEGFGALRPIYKFYENTVSNILKKQGFDPTHVTDEYGNTWNEITLNQGRDNAAIYLQKKDNTIPSKASFAVLNKIKEFAKKTGIDIKKLKEVFVNGEQLGINGVADALNHLVGVAEGKETEVLPEEVIHIAVEIIEQTNPKLFNQMLSRIGHYSIYISVLADYKNTYQKDGKPDIRKIKKEAIAKMLVNQIILKEDGGIEKPDQLEVKSWWDQIVIWLKNLFKKAGFDPFQEVAERVSNNQFEQGAAKNLKGKGGLFFQQDSEEINKLFQSFQQRIDQVQMKKIEQAPTGESDEEPSSYYEVTINGKTKKARRVTEIAKVKNMARNGGRDYFEGATKEQKEQWAQKALSGTKGHLDFQNIINAAIRADGTVLPKAEIDLSAVDPNTNPGIFSLIRDYLLGTTDQEGLLYSFPIGTRFITEQMVYSEKDNEGGTIDLMALRPDNTVEVIDWKFMGFDLERNPDIPPQKRQQHAIQLGEYKKILSTYGLKPSQIKARTVPIHAQYSIKREETKGKPKFIPVLEGITLGKVRMKEETRTYLLSVVPESQSTGVVQADDLIKALKSQYKKLYSRKADDHGRELKNEELNQLSATIRNLQTSLNFEPLAEQALSFGKNIERLIEKYKSFPQDISQGGKEEVNEFLQELGSAIKLSRNYAGMDKTFIQAYGKEDLTEQQHVVLKKLKEVSSDISLKQDDLLNMTRDITERIAEKEGVQNILSPEKELTGLVKDFRELGAQQNKALQVFSSIFSRAKGKAKLKTDEEVHAFGKIFQAFSRWGQSKGKSLFELIASKDGHTLIAETSKELWVGLKEAAKNKDIKWIKENINIEQYNQVYGEALQKFEEEVKRVSDNEQENIKRINNWKQKYDINNTRFFGWDNWIIRKTLKKENWYTPEYKELLREENKPALDMYNFIVSLNKRGFASGYLEGKKSLRFLPFILGTTMQRLTGSESGFLQAMQGSIADRFSVLADEDVKHSRIDEETGEIKRAIPKFYTTDISKEVVDKEGNKKRDYSELSHDLNRIIPLYIASLNDYEAAQNIEATAEALQIVEENKGHLEVDKLNNIITEGHSDTPREFKGNEKNTDVLKAYVDDGVYGIKYDRNSWADKLFGSMTQDEDKKLSAVKIIQQTNKLTQLKALGLKLLVALPNAFGANMQAVVNAGRLNTATEFFKNEMKVVGSAFQGREGNILKGLIDYFIPLNEDLVKHASRQIAQTPFEKLKYWNISDVLMSGLSVPDKVIQMAQALSILDNTMVESGKLVNIREHLKHQPEWRTRYKSGNVKAVEKEFNQKVKELQKTRSLKHIASFENGHLVIPGIERVSDTVAHYRNLILSTSRQITGQMGDESKRLYSRDIIKRSFMMFKNWIPQLVENRFGELKENKSIDSWEYGRIRVFFKVLSHLGLKKIGLLKDIVTASPKGLEHLHQLWEEKKASYLKKTGKDLSSELSEEEFYDLIRNALAQEGKEAALLFSMLGLLMYSHAAVPPDDDDRKKNLFKMMARLANKTSDEILFYYDPRSAESITRGSIIPSLTILSDARRVLVQSSTLLGAEITGDQDAIDNTHPAKALLNTFPISNYFANELLPLMDPEMAKEMGIRVNAQARPGQ